MREQLEPRRRKLSAEAAARDRFGHTYLYAPAGTPLGDQMGRLTERSRGMDGAALSRVQEVRYLLGIDGSGKGARKAVFVYGNKEIRFTDMRKYFEIIVHA